MGDIRPPGYLWGVLQKFCIGLHKNLTNGPQKKKLDSPHYNPLFDIISIPNEAFFISIDEFVDVCALPNWVICSRTTDCRDIIQRRKWVNSPCIPIFAGAFKFMLRRNSWWVASLHLTTKLRFNVHPALRTELQGVPNEVLSLLPSQASAYKNHAKNLLKRGPSCSHETMVS